MDIEFTIPNNTITHHHESQPHYHYHYRTIMNHNHTLTTTLPHHYNHHNQHTDPQMLELARWLVRCCSTTSACSAQQASQWAASFWNGIQYSGRQLSILLQLLLSWLYLLIVCFVSFHFDFISFWLFWVNLICISSIRANYLVGGFDTCWNIWVVCCGLLILSKNHSGTNYYSYLFFTHDVFSFLDEFVVVDVDVRQHPQITKNFSHRLLLLHNDQLC